MGKKREDNIRQFTHKYSKVCVDNNAIDAGLFDEYGVKRGLRDKNGKGVLSGLTNISLIKSSEEVDGKTVPCEGQLYYRGYNIYDLVRGFQNDGRYGFDECAYLLLFGKLPDVEELGDFKRILAYSMTLPTNFVRDVIMKASSGDIMNSLTKSVLMTELWICRLTMYFVRALCSLACFRCSLYMDIMHTIIMSVMRVCTFTDQIRAFPQQKIC